MRVIKNKTAGALSLVVLFGIISCNYAPKPDVSEPETLDQGASEETAEKVSSDTIQASETIADQPTEPSPESRGVAIEDLIESPTYKASEKIEPAVDSADLPEQQAQEKKPLKQISETPFELCKELGAKLSSVSEEDCLNQKLVKSGTTSLQGRDLAHRDYLPVTGKTPLGRVLVIGGIHGDEFSSVSVVFKWMDILNEHHSGLFHWRIIPSSNPDGLLGKKSQRQNANGVDLNRNFPTSDWDHDALSYWRTKASSQPRRYPGKESNSEPETKWLVEQINSFDPDVIISMHAPYHLVDYDGPPTAPRQLGSLYLRKLGTFPGSLGNYAGVDLELPIVTVELASAGIMPSEAEIAGMWDDLISWLRKKLN